jgi:hypothetical protein
VTSLHGLGELTKMGSRWDEGHFGRADRCQVEVLEWGRRMVGQAGAGDRAGILVTRPFVVLQWRRGAV